MKKITVFIFIVFCQLVFTNTFAQPDSLYLKPIENSECSYRSNDTINSIGYEYIWDGGCIEGLIDGEGDLIIRHPDGEKEIYKGRAKNGQFDGFVIYKFENEIYYEGEYKNGKPHGKGTFISDNEKYKYEGEFKNGHQHGYGIATFRSGNYYEGEFENGKPNGYGKFTFSDGSVYEGEFVNDEMHGKGTLKYSNGNKYVGYFYEGQRTGKGELFVSDGTYCRGEFKNDKMNGKGEISYPSGFKYIGELKNDAPYNGVVLDDEGFVYMRITEGEEKRVYGKEKWEGE